MRETDTKQRILDVAEEMFADRGFGGTSLRSITGAAKVNLAAVHYHFRSKEALLQAVVVRRLEPLNRERLALLDEYEKKAGRGGPSIEQILDALLAPPIRFIRTTPEGSLYGKLLGRLHSEPQSLFVTIARKHFGRVLRRFQSALRTALPGLPAEDFFWRMHFTVGAMAHTLGQGDLLETVSGGLCRLSDAEVAIPQLINFIAAGLRARPPARKVRVSSGRRPHSEKHR